MTRLALYCMLAICLLLPVCGEAGGSAPDALVTNNLVVRKTGGNFQEVRHIVLRGSNQEIGKAIARISKENYQANPQTFPDLASKTSRYNYIRQHFPQLAARQRGVEAYYGWGNNDLHDSSSLWYENQPAACSAIFFPKTVTANGHSFQARNMDFYTVDIQEFATGTAGKGNKLFSRNYVLETYPRDGGYATMVVGTFDLLNGVYDGFNEHGLTISGLVDQGLANSKGGIVDLTQMMTQNGLSYMQMVRLILESARTVEDVQQIVSKLSVYFPMDAIHFLIGDRNGKSVILEFYKKDPADAASPMNFIVIPQGSGRPTILTNHSVRTYPDPGSFPKPASTAPYVTYNRYLRLYHYLQASLFHYYTPDDGLYAMSMVYGYSNDASEGAAKPFPVRTIWSLVMDLDDLSLKIKFYTVDHKAQQTPLFTDALTFTLKPVKEPKP